jgi:hypothetical protein
MDGHEGGCDEASGWKIHRVRPSGGRLVVDVRHRPSQYAALIRDLQTRNPYSTLLARYGGDWMWEVPMPKNHPQPPPMQTLHGRAETQADAIAKGKARLSELYDPLPVEITREKQRAQSINYQHYLDNFRARKAAGLATPPGSLVASG